MHVRQLTPFASVALLVAVTRPSSGVATGAAVLAMVATLPWAAIVGAMRPLSGRGAQPSPLSGADTVFANGWDHLQSEEFTDAEAAFRRVLEQRPADGDALLYLGLALAGQGRHAEAVAPLRAAVAARPLDAEAQAWLGASLAEVGEVFLAATALRDALRLRPGFRPAEQVLERLLPLTNAPEEERTAFVRGGFPPPAARRRSHRYTRRTMPGSSLELQAGA